MRMRQVFLSVVVMSLKFLGGFFFGLQRCMRLCFLMRWVWVMVCVECNVFSFRVEMMFLQILFLSFLCVFVGVVVVRSWLEWIMVKWGQRIVMFLMMCVESSMVCFFVSLVRMWQKCRCFLGLSLVVGLLMMISLGFLVIVWVMLRCWCIFFEQFLILCLVVKVRLMCFSSLVVSFLSF